VKIKASELTGAALDWAVAEAIKPQLKNPERFNIGTFGSLFGKGYKWPAYSLIKYAPSTDWAEAGPIIEREEIGLQRNVPCMRGREWEATPSITAKGAGGRWAYGPTPLIAAMRCFVASKLGDEVDVPDVLFDQGSR
jgi:hypothetical protein